MEQSNRSQFPKDIKKKMDFRLKAKTSEYDWELQVSRKTSGIFFSNDVGVSQDCSSVW